jgi:hypothetical protein
VGAAAGAWLAGVAVAVAVEPQGWGTGHAALAAAQMYWLVRLPELTLIAAPAIMTWLIWTEPPAAYAAAVAALAYGWAAARHRIDVRRRQRLLAANAAQGVRLALPQPVPPLRRGAVRIGAGVALAVPAIWYPPLGAVALTLAAEGTAAFYRAARLRRGPVPVLRALAQEDEDGRLWVYAADDTAGRRPLFSCPVSPEADQDPESEGTDGTSLRRAVLFGAPYERAELLLLRADRDDGPLVDRAAGPVRPVRSA